MMKRCTRSSILFTLFAVFIVFPALVAAADGPLIFGAGVGVFAIGLGGVFAILLCIFGLATPFPWVVAFVATLIPIILFLIFFLAPTDSELSEDLTRQTDVIDSSFGWRVAFFILAVLGMLLALFFLFLESCMTALKAPRVDSGVLFFAKGDLQDAAEQRNNNNDKVSELFSESPRSFDQDGFGRGSYHQDSQIFRPASGENEGLSRAGGRRRLGESGTEQLVESDNRGPIRRRLE